METQSNPGHQTIDLSDKERLEARITGSVQNVGYRAFVRTTARHLGVDGWVRNEDDGTVTVVAEATPEVLDEFDAHLRKGPGGADVNDIQSNRTRAEGLPDPFEVR